MKKHFLAMIMAAVLGLSLVGCGSNGTGAKAGSNGGSSQTAAEGSGEAADSEGKSPMKIAVVCSDNLGDKSYNNSCNAGAQQATKDFGVKVKNLESTTADEWKANLLACYEGGYDLVVCSDSSSQEYLEEYKDSYPDVKFAIIDITVERPSVVSVSFVQNQGSFLVDAVAAMSTTHSEVEGVNDDAIIGRVEGQNIPVLRDFYVGFGQRAKYINPDITILQSYAGTWIDPLKDKELTLAQYKRGADIVMSVASGTGTDILETAEKAGKYAIGVNSDQDSGQPGHIVTSMVKRVDTACYSVIEPVVEDNFKGGITSHLEIPDDGIGLADFAVTKEHLGDKFPVDAQDKVQELKDKIISGKIVINNYEEFDKGAQ